MLLFKTDVITYYERHAFFRYQWNTIHFNFFPPVGTAKMFLKGILV
jgi:hypothetical protein